MVCKWSILGPEDVRDRVCAALAGGGIDKVGVGVATVVVGAG